VAAKISNADLHRIASLFEMVQRASQENADEHVRNEGINATGVLLRLLAKYGLDLSDVPDIQRQHEQAEAAKAAATTATPTSDPKAPNALQLVRHLLQEYVDMAPHEYIGTALWILHAHVVDRFQISPRLLNLSPVRKCGKTRVLNCLERLVPNPERHAHISAASLFRILDDGNKTILLDEGDNADLPMDHVKRTVLNDGWQKGGSITRTIKGEQRRFSTYGAVSISAIGILPLPLMRRAVVNRMQRSARTDLKTLEMMVSPAEAQRFEAVRRYAVTWAQNAQFNPDPQLPRILRGSMAEDSWRVLISIADSFQSDYWSKAARDAAIAYTDGFQDEDAPIALLYDTRLIMRRLGVDRIKGAILASELHALEDGMGVWLVFCGMNGNQPPHPITQGDILAMFRRFDLNLVPKPLFDRGSREDRGKAGRGWYVSQLERWWKIYCPEKDQEDEANNVQQLRSKPKSK
jgi:hypothetical protein